MLCRGSLTIQRRLEAVEMLDQLVNSGLHHNVSLEAVQGGPLVLRQQALFRLVIGIGAIEIVENDDGDVARKPGFAVTTLLHDLTVFFNEGTQRGCPRPPISTALARHEQLFPGIGETVVGAEVRPRSNLVLICPVD